MIQMKKDEILNGINVETEQTNQMVPVTSNDVQTYTQDLKSKLRALPEVEALTSQINVEDLNSVLVFGKEASEGISKVSDGLLSTMKGIKAEEAGEMIVQLTKIMDKFDIKDFEKAKAPSMIEKLMGKAKNAVEAMFKRYETMGSEVDKVYVILKKYEQDIKVSNNNLKKMYDANIEFYQELEKYIVAGEIALEEMDNSILPEYLSQAEKSGDQKDMLYYQQLTQVREMIDQRVYDLRIAENIALQTIPMIQSIQYGNYNLIRKINSSFIITLPIFKQCLAQAVMLKRQELQAKSLSALDEKTNELLLRNAQNVANQTTNIARMAGTSSVQIQTLEKTWTTIMSGINEAQRIQEQNQSERVSNTARLETIKQEILAKKKK